MDDRVILYGMCSNCGMVIIRDAVTTDMLLKIKMVSMSAEGAEWVYFPG